MKIKVKCLILAAIFAAMTLYAGAQMPDMLIPGGNTVGIWADVKGLLVTAVEADSPAEKAGLKQGDMILEVEGRPLKSADELKDRMTDGSVLYLGVEREKKARAVAVLPEQQGDAYRMGAYVRDHVAGIGTVSYYDPESGAFGALGHGISDPGGTAALPIEGGNVVPSKVSEVVKGVSGAAGRLKGEFDIASTIGTVRSNTENGVFGSMSAPPWQPLPVARAEEVRCGNAQILSNIRNREVEEFEIEILRCHDKSTSGGKDMLIRVTDPELLETTGGIVQGMSGSPICQNGKIVGAVTHVLVNDPTRGYGIFIENMLDAAG